MKNSFSLPKLQFTGPSQLLQLDTRHAAVHRQRESTWQQATLPIRKGGIGVRLAAQVALPFFLSSVASLSAVVLQLLPPSLHSPQFSWRQ